MKSLTIGHGVVFSIARLQLVLLLGSAIHCTVMNGSLSVSSFSHLSTVGRNIFLMSFLNHRCLVCGLDLKLPLSFLHSFVGV